METCRAFFNYQEWFITKLSKRHPPSALLIQDKLASHSEYVRDRILYERHEFGFLRIATSHFRSHYFGESDRARLYIASRISLYLMIGSELALHAIAIRRANE